MSNSGRNIVDEIKSRCNIVDVIGRAVPLKRAGSNYKGCCPFHNEKTPSFVVSETKQIFTCFGCGATGDVISFVSKYNNLDFKGAVEYLAKEYGISLEGAFGGSRERDELYEMNRQAARFFFKAMRERANPGYTYMKKRGISDEILNKFGIGYADDSWNSLYDFLKSKGFPEKKLLDLGLISTSKGRFYDKFRGRVIFPILNTSGKVIGFGGRILGDGEPKYLNSQESPVFRKKYNLYGLNLARNDVTSEDGIILVEGYMDVISLYQAGIRNVSASLGTALTEDQAALIKRYTKNVYLCYDSDNAGQNAAFRGLDILYGEGLRARVMKVTDGKDPDEFVKKNGRTAFTDLLKDALPYGDFKINRIKEKYDLDSRQDKLDFLQEAIGILQAMKPVEADMYMKRLSEETGISESAIRNEYSRGGSRIARAPDTGRHHEEEERTTDIPLIEKDLLKLMLLDRKFTVLPDDIRDKAVTSDIGRTIHDAVVRMYEDTGFPDIKYLRGMLDENASDMLEKINDNIIPDGRDDIIFSDCIARIRKNELKRREEELMARIDMADEDENKDDIIELTRQLMDIQKKIKE